MKDRMTHYKTTRGWFRSVKEKASVDANGNPIPWWPYNLIEFVDRRLTSDLFVWEWGSGNSTLWFAQRVAHVHSVEHDKEWFAKVSELTRNEPDVAVELISLKVDAKYCHRMERFEPYDIVHIDGRDRVNCARNCRVAFNGCIIWDNTNRKRYEPGIQYLLDQGFTQKKFRGLGPINPSPWQASIFYRNNNCLGIA